MEEESHPTPEEGKPESFEVIKKFMKRFGSHAAGNPGAETELSAKTEEPMHRATLKSDVQHYTLATPPVTPVRPSSSHVLWETPPGLAHSGYPLPSSTVPTRYEEKTMAQKQSHDRVSFCANDGVRSCSLYSGAIFNSLHIKKSSNHDNYVV